MQSDEFSSKEGCTIDYEILRTGKGNDRKVRKIFRRNKEKRDLTWKGLSEKD